MMEVDETKGTEGVENFDGVNYKGNKGPRFGVRHLQVILMSIGSAYAFTTKSAMTTLIVAMTDNSTSTEADVPYYDWSNTSVIISAVMWGGMFVTVLSGYLGKRYGPKWFIVGSSALNCLVFGLIPLAAKLGGSNGVIVCRVIQGAAISFLGTQGGVLSGHWNPPEERARMTWAGSAVVTILAVIGSISTGFVSTSSLGWPAVFYIFGFGGLLWSVAFAIWGSSSPLEHKSIDPDEKRFLEVVLFISKEKEKRRTPWKEIYTSKHFWAIVIGSTGFTWVATMMSTELTMFLAKVMDYDLKSNALIGAAPVLTTIVCGASIAILSDYVVTHKILSVINSRRTFQLSGVVGICLVLIIMTLIPVEHRSWTIACLCIADIFMLLGAIGGAGLNTLDIAPEYVGIIGGFTGIFSEFISLFAPLTVQWMIPDLSDASQWRNVFYVTTVIAIPSAIFFCVFATDKKQTWGDDDLKYSPVRKATHIKDSGP